MLLQCVYIVLGLDIVHKLRRGDSVGLFLNVGVSAANTFGIRARIPAQTRNKYL